MKEVKKSNKYTHWRMDATTLQSLRQIAGREKQSMIGELRIMIEERNRQLDERKTIEAEITQRQQHNRKVLLATEAKV